MYTGIVEAVKLINQHPHTTNDRKSKKRRVTEVLDPQRTLLKVENLEAGGSSYYSDQSHEEEDSMSQSRANSNYSRNIAQKSQKDRRSSRASLGSLVDELGSVVSKPPSINLSRDRDGPLKLPFHQEASTQTTFLDFHSCKIQDVKVQPRYQITNYDRSLPSRRTYETIDPHLAFEQSIGSQDSKNESEQEKNRKGNKIDSKDSKAPSSPHIELSNPTRVLNKSIQAFSGLKAPNNDQSALNSQKVPQYRLISLGILKKPHIHRLPILPAKDVYGVNSITGINFKNYAVLNTEPNRLKIVVDNKIVFKTSSKSKPQFPEFFNFFREKALEFGLY